MKYILATDIGGTTFNTGLFSESLNLIAISPKDKIRYHKDKKEVIQAIISQINNLIEQNIERKDIIGLGIAVPGPLNTTKGKILDTPNLKIFQNYNIANDFTQKLKIDTYIENDANLFTLGEWYSQYKKYNVFMGVTLGTGLGLGVVINGKLFTGGNGLAFEYSLSPFKWGKCEENVCIRFIRKRAKLLYGKEISPVIIEKYYKKGDQNAIKIYHEFGYNLGIVLSHAINMIDPQAIAIGGGLSNGFNCFKNSMKEALENHSPSFNINNIIIKPSTLREQSTMIGASILVKNIKK